MNVRAKNFLAANELSPVVYGSCDEAGVTYRLANGQVFRLGPIEARSAPNPRWAFVEREMNAPALAEYAQSESDTLDKMLAEAAI